jgi:hypothetical protein
MSRSASQIEFHYRVEKELAARLRSAPRAQRLRLYGEVYDELFRRVPEHPQLHRKHSLEEQRAAIDDRLALLRRFIDRDTVFLEIGAGDACLTREVARIARRSYALDVSHEILDAIDDPRVTAVWSDGCSVPVPDDSVTLAYSYQVMEHIHPDDALEQLRNLHRALAPGGVYVASRRTARTVRTTSRGSSTTRRTVSISGNTRCASSRGCSARWASDDSRRTSVSAAASCASPCGRCSRSRASLCCCRPGYAAGGAANAASTRCS